MKKFIEYLLSPIFKLINWIIGIIFRPRPSVSLSLSTSSYFVGAYEKIRVKVKILTFDDVYFTITEGAPGGYISLCRDADFDPANPDIMLCFGYKPGIYHIEARKVSDSSLISTSTYKLDTVWMDEVNGPSISFCGISEGLAVGASWGGGPAGTPQNVNVHPATGTRKAALLMVDTSSQRYTSVPADLQAIKDAWLQNYKNGFVCADGVTRSALQYYQEASFNTFGIDCDLFGPVQLAGDFDSYIDANSAPKAGFDQACITAGDALIDYNQYQSIIFVMQPWNTTDAMGAPLERSPWPQAWGGTFSTSEGDKSLRVLQMPYNWSTKPIYATISHEMGHNLGLWDQYDGDGYTPAVNARTLANWELMAYENLIPQFTIAHRLMFGWIHPDWVKTYDFALNGGLPVNETVTLNAIENSPPPAGRFAGIEVRIADGWNYYIEYRKGQGPEISDRSLPTDSAVLVTDVISEGYTAPFTRPLILKVPNDPDGDGSVLINGLDYREADISSPTFPTDFRISVNGIDGTKADVTIQYGVNSKPDPSIRPWPASPDRQYQSPDIEVQNVRNQADATWFNVPWVGHDNTVIAQIKNSGNLNAPGVMAQFFVLDFNTGGATPALLGTDTHDINHGDTVPFSVHWIPPAEGHFCIMVKIPLYQVPTDLAVVEITELNNIAQSNYTRFISATSSPASREITYVTVGNPYPKASRVYIFPNQTNPLYRTYLEHKLVYLQPGETRKVKVMFEYDPHIISHIPVSLGSSKTIDDSNRKQLAERVVSEYHAQPNRSRFGAIIENPYDEHRHVKEFLGGAEVEIVTGRKTRFSSFFKESNRVSGAVITVDDGQPVTSGSAILTAKRTDKNGKTVEVSNVVKVNNIGRFDYSYEQAEKITSVQAYYLPPKGFGDCYSDVKK